MTSQDADIDLLARTAYETGISPAEYAVRNVIQAHVDAFLAVREGRTACIPDPATEALSCRILGDLLSAGVSLPEVTR